MSVPSTSEASSTTPIQDQMLADINRTALLLDETQGVIVNLEREFEDRFASTEHAATSLHSRVVEVEQKTRALWAGQAVSAVANTGAMGIVAIQAMMEMREELTCLRGIVSQQSSTIQQLLAAVARLEASRSS